MILDILFVVAVVGILIAIYKTKFSQKKTVEELKAEILRETTPQIKPTQKQQPLNQPTTAAEWAGEESDSSENSDNEANQQNDRKQLYKQQKRREKQQRKQAQQHFLQQQKQKREEYEKQQQQKEREQQQKRRKQQEYIEQMREEQRKRKEEEFNKWKDMFSVEQTGVTQESEDVLKRKEMELEENLRVFLINKKLTLLEDASHKFSLQTKDLVEKIKKLQAQKKISGVFDERGKFLYIDQKEWEAVKNYITAKGRLKKSDMMNECAKIIKIPEDNDDEFIKLVNSIEEQA